MKSHSRTARRGIAIALTAVLALTAVFAQSLAVSAADENVYCKQMGKGYCTLASATMMLRSKGKLENMSGWTSITQSTLKSTAWLNGAGLRHSFTYKGMSVSYGDFGKSSQTKATLLAMLKKHPEGIEIYERALPHAIFLTRYDSSTDTFYCADPALSASERTLASSYLRHVSSSSAAAKVQEDIIRGLDSYWYISKYNSTASSAYDNSDVASDTGTKNSGSASNTGNTTAKPSDNTGNTTAKPSDNTGNTTAKPSDNTGNTTANPSDNTGNTTAKPSDNTGNTTAKPSDNTGNTTAKPSDNTGTAGDNNEDTDVTKPDTDNTDGVLDDSNVSKQNTDQIADGGGSAAGIISDGGSDTGTVTAEAVKVKFDKVNSFSGISFSDVESNDWFYSSVQSAYEMALMNGVSDSEFGTDVEVTISQAVTIAARIHAIYASFKGTAVPDFTPAGGEPWYAPYADYAYESGVIGTKYYSIMQVEPDTIATRAQFAEILSGALPAEALASVNTVPAGSVSDVDINTTAGKAIYELYRAGVLAGTSDGTFNPDSSIKRTEVAAIVSRMADSDMRVAL
ncbi:MAG: S-layer homology domain-containing protein [Eubacteriales bacterium]|nr:S-layer homology domain-containing protein [Eubacteriales bacterium]